MTTTADEVWQLLRELIESQKKIDEQQRKTDRKIKEFGKVYI